MSSVEGLVNNFDFREDFFKVNPELLLIKEFKELKKSNKDYSKILWYIAYAYDGKSKFFNYSEKSKPDLLKHLLSTEEYNKYQELIINLANIYTMSYESPIQRMLRIWKNKLDEKMFFIEATPYDATNWEMLDKMQANFVQAYKQYEQILKELSKDEGANKGNSKDSLSDKGDI
jgi:hypothetical protein